jgi:hypothetical protein
MNEETYLGDGLYASIERSMIKLRAPRFGGGDHVVYLDPEVWAALQQLAAQVWPAGPEE